jgi:butyrate kinase
MGYKILCINPGSTSTKIGLFDDTDEVWRQTLCHSAEDLAQFSCNNEQIPFRTQGILDALDEHGVKLADIDAFAARGGGQAPHLSGTYRINELMVREAHDEIYGSHPATLACQICWNLAGEHGKPSFITNGPATDEMRQIAKLTGVKGVYRIGYCHVLNQKEVGRRYGLQVGKPYDELNLVICHLGGGISVSAHRHGRIVDTNDVLNGDGPMSPNRTGFVAAVEIARIACKAVEEGHTCDDVVAFIRSKGGLSDHLGTFDVPEVRRRIDAGDIYAKNVYDAMIYQITKQIGAMAAALDMDVDAVILTGGIAHDDYLCDRVARSIEGFAPVVRMPGEFEMEALAYGAYDAMANGNVREYTGVPVWTPDMLYETCEP